MTILLIYTITQLLGDAIGITTIDSLRPRINQIIRENGYNPNKINSALDLNDKLVKILKSFIPFYYLYLSLSLVLNKDNIEKYALKEIETNKYKKEDNNEEIEEYNEELEKEVDESVINENFKVNIRPQKQYNWGNNNKEKYVARKIDSSLFDNSETPDEYLERINNETLVNETENLTPFNNEMNIINEENTSKQKVSNSDIVSAIADLDYKQLDELESKIKYLSNLKKNKQLTLDKEVA